MSEQLTHWKKLGNPNYLGSHDLMLNDSESKEVTLTVATVKQEKVKGTDGSESDCIVASWVELGIKPMILNKTNCKVLAKLAKSNFIEKWANQKCTIEVKKVKAFGDYVDALRIKTTVSAPKSIDITDALIKMNGAQDIAELGVIWKGLSKDEQAHPDVIRLKDELKTQLA